MSRFWILGWIVGSLASGALFGLIPYFTGRSRQRPKFGYVGFWCCCASGLLGIALFVAIGFVIAILTSKRDWGAPQAAALQEEEIPWVVVPGGYDQGPKKPNVQLACVSGPLHGRVYRIGREG